MKTRTPESAVLSACLEYLAWRGVFAGRTPQGAVPLPGGKGFRRFAGIRGLPDILGVLPRAVLLGGSEATVGQFLGVEVKSAAGRVSAEQKAFHQRAAALGAAVAVVRDVKELEAFLDGMGVGKAQ